MNQRQIEPWNEGDSRGDVKDENSLDRDRGPTSEELCSSILVWGRTLKYSWSYDIIWREAEAIGGRPAVAGLLMQGYGGGWCCRRCLWNCSKWNSRNLSFCNTSFNEKTHFPIYAGRVFYPICSRGTAIIILGKMYLLLTSERSALRK